MANFQVNGSGLVDLRGTDLEHYDGITFATSGDTRVQLASSQYYAGPGLHTDSVYVGSGYQDTLEIFVQSSATFSALSFGLVSWSDNDRIILHDTITGNETLSGSNGNDIITVSGGVDTVDGGIGNDLLVIDWHSDTLGFVMAGAGAISNFSNTQVNFSRIESFDATFGSGNDSVVLTGGDDIVRGGGGNDTLNTAAGAAVVDGGSGTDIWAADLSAFVTGFTVDLGLAGTQAIGNRSSLTGIEGLVVTGSKGDDVLITRHDDPNDGIADVLNGFDGNDTLGVGGGIDTVDGGAGDDLLVIDWASDTASFGMAGANRITDFSNTQVTFANIERFDVTLGSGNDSIVLLGGDDIVRGGGGNDTLNTGAGAAVVDGGTGTDIWAADLSAFTAGFTVDLGLAGAQDIGNRSSLTGIEGLAITGSKGDDVLITRHDDPNDGIADVLNGFDGNDTLGVGGGIDTVDGGAGDDLLVIDWASDTASFGMAGANRITDFSNTQVTFTNIERFDVTLGSGNDSIVLLGGDDIVHGGAGNDTLNTGAGAAVVDGGTGTDIWAADLSAFTAGFTVDLGLAGVQDIGNRSSLTGIEGLSITGSKGDDVLITRHDDPNDGIADVLNGFDGNDTLGVGGGIDTVDGGAGDDLLVIDWTGDTANFAMAGANTITDFSNTQVSFTNIERFDVRLGSGNDSIVLLGGDDIVRGGGGNDTLDGGGGNDTADWSDATAGVTWVMTASGGGTATGDGTDTLSNFENATGGAGNDVFTGNAAANRLDGGAGADILTGGAGDDTYVVDNAGDKTIEVAGGGNDTVLSSVDWTLAAQVETLRLTGAAIRGIGNGLDNVIVGTAAANVLNGGAGADVMTGGAGDDTYVVDNAGDKTIEVAGGGNDTVLSSVDWTLAGQVETLRLTGAAIRGIGNGLDNVIVGTAAANVLNGGGGADVMTGGAGDDTYVVDNAGDRTVEFAGGGNDTVQSSISWTLAAQIETLRLTGTAKIDGTGNSLDNALVGNAAANVLDGGAGADRMTGGGGDDIYVVDNTGDMVVEAVGGGNDTVRSSVTFALAAYVENLVLTGSGAIGGTGNALANTLTGNAGANSLDGGAGADRMIGGNGSDTYVVDNAGDVVDETGTLGLDSVRASISFDLADGSHVLGAVENLALTGAKAINAAGNALANVITGNDGNNSLDGRDGNDRLAGGLGADKLTGGAGADSFVFASVADSNQSGSGRDVILDFHHAERDRIVLSGIDADIGVAGDQAFTFVGTAGFSHHAGELRYAVVNGNAFVYGDVDGDGAADVSVQLNGVATLQAADFVL